MGSPSINEGKSEKALENNPEYKISEKEAKGFLSEIKRLTKEDKTNMPPLVVIIMAYINMLFPELDEVKI